MPASFNGTNQKLEIGDEPTFDLERDAAQSFAAYILMPVIGGECVAGKATLGPPQRGVAYNTEVVNNSIAISTHLVNSAPSDHLFVQSEGLGQPNLWIHATWTYDGTNTAGGVTHYFNGGELAVDSSVATLTGTILTDEPFRIAGHNDAGGEFWAGSVCGAVWDDREFTAAEAAQLGRPGRLYRHPSGLLTVAPELWLPLTARANGSSFDSKDESGNAHSVTLINSPTLDTTHGEPEIMIDWGNGGVWSRNFTGDDSGLTVTPDVALAGVLIFIVQTTVATDLITSVTYGGVGVPRIPLFDGWTGTRGMAEATSTESGAVYCYFLGSNVPTGAATVAFDVTSGTDAKTAFVFGLLCDGEIVPIAAANARTTGVGTITNPSVTLTTPVDSSLFVAAAVFSGLAAPSNLTALSGYTPTGGRDFGNQSATTLVANRGGTTNTPGWTAGAEDCAIIGVAFARKQPRLPAFNFQNPALA